MASSAGVVPSAVTAVAVIITIFVLIQSKPKAATVSVKLECKEHDVAEVMDAVVQPVVARLGFTEFDIRAGELFVLPLPPLGKPGRPDCDGLTSGKVAIDSTKCIFLDLGNSEYCLTSPPAHTRPAPSPPSPARLLTPNRAHARPHAGMPLAGGGGGAAEIAEGGKLACDLPEW